MKKIVSILMVLGFSILTCGSASAAWFDKDKTAQAVPAASKPKPVSPATNVVAKKKAELNGKEWNIELRPSGASGKIRPETDVISFAEDKVVSKALSGSGFAATNFSTRLEEDGTVVWETMQVSEKAGTAFWRGDIGPDGIMRGVLSKRDAKGNIKDFNFASTIKAK